MIDCSFNCHLDANGRDPDSHSATLRRHHQALWSKPLPGGEKFHLDISGRKPFLVHQSSIGEFHLTSDCIVHRYASRPWIAPFVLQLPDSLRTFVEQNAWPVTDCIVFPGKMIDGKATINGERGMNRKVGDRFDLTLECIRRHYLGLRSPLSAVLERNASFFALFESFAGYVDFFLLQDLVENNHDSVRFYLPFDDFVGDPLPRDLEAYTTYLRRVTEFSAGRRIRAEKWCRENLSASAGPQHGSVPK